MSNIQVFQHRTFGLVRMVQHDDAPWFLAADICQALGLSNTTEALRNLDPDEKSSEELMVGTRPQLINIVSESGMYTLIMRSNKPDAKAFRKWVTGTVLPAIRKTGSYSSCSTEDLVAKTIGNPDWAIQMLTAYKEEQEKRKTAEQERDEAIRTKTFIQKGREATVINKLAVKSRECVKLREENTGLKRKLGIELNEDEKIQSEYKAIRQIKWIRDMFRDDASATINSYLAYHLKNITRHLKMQTRMDEGRHKMTYPLKAFDVLHERVAAGEIPALEKFKK